MFLENTVYRADNPQSGEDSKEADAPGQEPSNEDK